MVTISDYIAQIYADFDNYVTDTPALCDLRAVNFTDGNIPNYSDFYIQQYYLLRYAYSCAFEYKLMYERLFAACAPRGDLCVTSIGCGAMLDYWALANVMDRRAPAARISYLGIDQVNWNYRMLPRPCDHSFFIQNDALRALRAQNLFCSDIFFFPKSISEFDSDDFTLLCSEFKRKISPFQRTLHVMITMRKDEYTRRIDEERAAQLRAAIEASGLRLMREELDDLSPEVRSQRISALDPDFSYPYEVTGELIRLFSRCSRYPDRCLKDPQLCGKKYLGWYPVLRATQIHYTIMTFERV